MHTIRVTSAEAAMIRMTVHDLKYKGYFHIGCTFGGIFIIPGFVESICSSKKADQIQSTYSRNGLALGHKALLVLKVYHSLSKVKADLTFALDTCSSRFNFLPNSFLFPYYNAYFLGYEGIHWTTSHRYFSHGHNKYYFWPEPDVSYHMLLLAHSYDAPCWVINSVMLSQVHTHVIRFIENNPEVYLHVSSLHRAAPLSLSVAFVNPNPIIKNVYDCLANGLNVLPDNRNDEPYNYITSPLDVFSIRVHNAKIRFNLHCLMFGGSFHIKLEHSQDTENICFSEIGGYMYDAMGPVISQGICGDVLVQPVRWGKTYLSFQVPLIYDNCCYYDVLFVSSNYTDRVRVFQPSLYHNTIGYVVQRWHTRGRGSVKLLWRGICRVEYYFDSRSESFISTCMDMEVTHRSLHGMRLTYRASLITEDLSGNLHTIETMGYRKTIETLGYQKRLCLLHTCYTVPIGGANLSWTDAQQICKSQNSSLASINTAEDWKIITRNPLTTRHLGNISLLPVSGAQMFYIGYQTMVSEGGVLFNIVSKIHTFFHRAYKYYSMDHKEEAAIKSSLASIFWKCRGHSYYSVLSV